MARIDDILRAAVSQKASDIHFSADCPVMMRKHGELTPVDPKVYSSAELQEILLEIIDEKDRKRYMENKNLDKSYSVPNCGNFRLNYFWTRRGVGAVIRWLPTKMPDIDDLGLPSIVKKLCDLPKGLLLVTGPTGSGKSTTLASMINYMNTNFSYHILTVEDPVEFVHPCKKSLINQREIGQSCLTFADALKYALREDPDVILVGEMRDQETIGLALTAAETGHLVFGTLHTRGAASSVDRIIESFPATERPLIRVMLSESLRAVISQILLKGKDGNSRVAAYEIMVANYAISNLIREGKTFQIQSILQTAKGEGMIQMEAHIRQLMAEGKVDPVEADAVLSSMMRAQQQGSSTPAAPVATKPVSAQVQAPEFKGPKGGKPGGPKGPAVKKGSPEANKPPVLATQSPAKEAAAIAKPVEASPPAAKVVEPAAAIRPEESTVIGDKTVAGITVKAMMEKAASEPGLDSPSATAAPKIETAAKSSAFMAPVAPAAPPIAKAVASSAAAPLSPPVPPVAVAKTQPVAPAAAPAAPSAPPVAVPSAFTAPAAPGPTIPKVPLAAKAPAMPSAPAMPKAAPAAAPAVPAASPKTPPGVPPASPAMPARPPMPPAKPAPAVEPAPPINEKPPAVEVPNEVEELTKSTNGGFTKKTSTANRPLPTKKAG